MNLVMYGNKCVTADTLLNFKLNNVNLKTY